MTDPLGRSQVLPYLVGLAGKGHEVSLLSLEKPDRFARDGERVRAICDAASIDWFPQPYRRKPPVLAGIWNTFRLSRQAAKLQCRGHFDLVHARSDLASLAGRRLFAGGCTRFLYDMRALWPDERFDGGAWPQANPLFRLIYRKFKRHQAEFIERADAIICLTNAAKALVEGWPGRRPDAPVVVIPCATDFERIRPSSAKDRLAVRRTLGISEGEKVVTYLGSIGAWYMLDEMLDFFAVYRTRHPRSRFLVVTPDAAGPILAAAGKRGIAEALIVRSASPEEVGGLLGASDLGIFFIQPVDSKKASCPTKLGEMLAAGLPIVTNAGVGDVAEILRATEGGVAIEHFTTAAYEGAIRAIEDRAHDPGAVRDKALEWFDLKAGIEAYDGIYRQLIDRDGVQ